MMNIVLIRHTRPDVAQGTCYGREDLALPQDCAADFADVAARLAALGIRPARIYSSPLLRCLELAKFLFPSAAIQQDDRLREMHFGEWENRPWDQIPRAQLDRWAEDVTGFAPPAGESYADLYRRCSEFAQEQLRSEPDQSLQGDCCIITHAGAMRGLLAFFLQNRLVENNRSASDIPSDLLTHLLNEPIEFGTVCHIAIDATAAEIRYSLS